MQLAIITPTSELSQFAVLGDIHLVLAQIAMRDSSYAKFYINETKFKILDNGLFEEGKGLTPKELVRIAEYVQPDEVVLTDVLFDRKKTLEATIECYQVFKKLYTGKLLQFMAVPQADNVEDWVQSYIELSSLPFVNTIGLSKLSIPNATKMSISKGRVAVIDTYLSKRPICPIKQHHLLGSSNLAVQELQHYRAKKGYIINLRSMDTSAPYVYGVNGYLLRSDPNLIEKKLDFNAPQCNNKEIVENITDLEELAHDC